jgi:choice-of-anchor A domain-containing protein
MMQRHSAPTNADTTRDRGLTLVELVVTVVMISLVTTVIAASVIVIFRSQDGVVASTAESHDTGQVVSYLPHDIESGPSRADSYRATIGGDPAESGSGCDPVGTDNVLRIDVTNRRNDQIDKRIAYRTVSGSAEARIDRYECTFDGTNWVTDSVINVADYLDPTATPVAESEIFVSNPAAPVVDQEVIGVELRYVQRGATESIVAAPREEQPLSNSGLCGTDPLSAARNIASFIEGDVELHGTAVKSTLFVGGTLTFHGGTVGQASPDTPETPVPTDIGLIAGSIDWTNSTGALDVKSGRDVIIEDGNYDWVPTGATSDVTASPTSASPSISLGNGGVAIAPGASPVITAGDAFAELRACSDRLAGLPNSCNNGACAVHTQLPAGYGGTDTDAGNTRLDLTDDKANAFNIDESNLADLQTIQLDFAPGDAPDVATPLIINVSSAIGGTVSFIPPTLQGSGSNSVYVIWNFPNASVVELLAPPTGSIELRGSLLAPYSRVISEVSIQGGVIANQFEMFGSSLNDVRSFQGELNW